MTSTQPTISSTDEASVRAAVVALDEVQDDVAAFCGLLHEDVHIVNVAGIRVLGRETFRRAMESALAGGLGSIRTRAEVLGVHFLTSEVAVVDAVKHIDGGRRGAYTLTFVRDGDRWLAAALQTTPM